MRAFATSFVGLFQADDERPRIDSIEIPLIQRDYAQGREAARVDRIRHAFLDVLHAAVTEGEHVHLDFIYGTVEDGIFRPLDGQQRLTTLFLLHWYLAYRAGRLDEREEWKRFGYAVRPTARRFCEELVACRPPAELPSVSSWLSDQPWHLYTWKQDPTIQGMQVMLDTIHQRFEGADCSAAWERLVDASAPAITFHLLPIEEHGSGEALYIKMNSRGKPLTQFENFKARFEKLLERSVPSRADELAQKIDGEWADVFWPYRGDDDIIDDELLRYFHFVTEVCEWRAGRSPTTGDVEELAEQVFGPEREDAAEQVGFLIDAFDAWRNVDIPALFGELFSREPTDERLTLFGASDKQGIDLFDLCCRAYGEHRSKLKRVIPYGLTLLFYAVLVHEMFDTADFTSRLRVLRNLVEASGNELRLSQMAELIQDVEGFVRTGDLSQVTALNQAQLSEETLKAAMVEAAPATRPALVALEEHPLLRGQLGCFDLDPATLERRAATFHRAFVPALYPRLAPALLTKGDYSLEATYNTFLFGSPKASRFWRRVLARRDRTEAAKTRTVLQRFLDAIEGAEELESALDSMIAAYLQEAEEKHHFDWRYYIVKYPAMRSGDSGVFISDEPEMGYQLRLLDKRWANSYHRDAYLHTIREESELGDVIEMPPLFGYDNPVRWLKLGSGLAIRCVHEGLVVRPPREEHREAFRKVCEAHPVSEDGVLAVSQRGDERPIDSEDRVQVAVGFLRDSAASGL